MVFIRKLVLHVQPQGGMGGHIVPPKAHTMGQPRVDVMYECVCQVTGLLDAPSLQLPCHAVLPILQEDSYPCQCHRAADLYGCPWGGCQRGWTVAPLLKALWSPSVPASRGISACKALGRTPAVSSVGYPTRLWPILLWYTSRLSPQMPPGIWLPRGQGLGSGWSAWHVLRCSPVAALLPPPWASGMQTFHL